MPDVCAMNHTCAAPCICTPYIVYITKYCELYINVVYITEICELPNCKICVVVDGKPVCQDCNDGFEKVESSCDGKCTHIPCTGAVYFSA